MQTGVVPRFKIKRELDAHERGYPLRRDKAQPFAPDSTSAMVRFNSTYVEYVDRGFRQRGLPSAWIAAVSSALLFLLLIVGMYFVPKMYEDAVSISEIALISLVVLLFYVSMPVALLVFIKIALANFFAYTHYPIRFNRRTRKVYFFRHNGPGGTTVVDWDDPDVYFHIGRGANQKYLRDLRCHVLEDREVKQTFAIGYYWWHENNVRKQWEFIRRYMELGPDQCFDDPADALISLSTKRNWHNSVEHAYASGPIDLIRIGRLLYPFYALVALGHWIVQKTCKEPVWPPEVEAECQIDPGDPFEIREPEFSGEFDTPEAIERLKLKLKERERWEREAR